MPCPALELAGVKGSAVSTTAALGQGEKPSRRAGSSNTSATKTPLLTLPPPGDVTAFPNRKTTELWDHKP